MPIDFRCNYCERRGRVPSTRAGEIIECDRCHLPLTIPASSDIELLDLFVSPAPTRSQRSRVQAAMPPIEAPPISATTSTAGDSHKTEVSTTATLDLIAIIAVHSAIIGALYFIAHLYYERLWDNDPIVGVIWIVSIPLLALASSYIVYTGLQLTRPRFGSSSTDLKPIGCSLALLFLFWVLCSPAIHQQYVLVTFFVSVVVNAALIFGIPVLEVHTINMLAAAAKQRAEQRERDKTRSELASAKTYFKQRMLDTYEHWSSWYANYEWATRFGHRSYLVEASFIQKQSEQELARCRDLHGVEDVETRWEQSLEKLAAQWHNAFAKHFTTERDHYIERISEDITLFYMEQLPSLGSRFSRDQLDRYLAGLSMKRCIRRLPECSDKFKEYLLKLTVIEDVHRTFVELTPRLSGKLSDAELRQHIERYIPLAKSLEQMKESAEKLTDKLQALAESGPLPAAEPGQHDIDEERARLEVEVRQHAIGTGVTEEEIQKQVDFRLEQWKEEHGFLSGSD